MGQGFLSELSHTITVNSEVQGNMFPPPTFLMLLMYSEQLKLKVIFFAMMLRCSFQRRKIQNVQSDIFSLNSEDE